MEPPRNQHHYPRDPKWNVEYIMRRVFSHDQGAAWLVAKSDEPPTSITEEMMRFSVTSDMVTVLDPNLAPLYKPKSESSSHKTTGSSSASNSVGTTPGATSSDSQELQPNPGQPNPGQPNPGQPPSSKQPPSQGSIATSSQEQQQQPNMPFVLSSPEKMVCVFHGSYENRAYVTMTDTRSPFTFLEPPAETVQGVRRIVMEATQEDVLVSLYYWLSPETGRSCLACMRYFLDPKRLIQRCAFLIGPYPPNRYPTHDDVIESALSFEMLDCQFCLLRGLSSCDCNKLAFTRMRPRLPHTLQNANPWDIWSWFFLNYEKGLKKDKIVLTNHPTKFTISTDFLFQIIPTLGRSEQQHTQAYKYYLDQVFPCFQNKMLSWGIHNPERQDPHALSNVVAIRKSHGDTKNLCTNSERDPGILATQNDQHGLSISSSFIDELERTSKTKVEDIAPNQEPPPTKRRRFAPKEVVSADVVAFASAKKAEPENALDAPDYDEADVDTYLEEIGNLPWNQGSFSCKLCGPHVTFSRKYDLKRHVTSKHISESRKFFCELCGQKFKRQEHLDSHHRQIHSEKQGFACEHCGKVLLSEVNRRRHIRNMHTP